LPASLRFFSAKVRIKPSIPPLFIPAAKLPLYVSVNQALDAYIANLPVISGFDDNLRVYLYFGICGIGSQRLEYM